MRIAQLGRHEAGRLPAAVGEEHRNHREPDRRERAARGHRLRRLCGSVHREEADGGERGDRGDLEQHEGVLRARPRPNAHGVDRREYRNCSRRYGP